MQDLTQIGVIGLIKAIEPVLNPSLSYSFSMGRFFASLLHGESVLVVVKRLILSISYAAFCCCLVILQKETYKNGQYNFKKNIVSDQGIHHICYCNSDGLVPCVDSGISQTLIFFSHSGAPCCATIKPIIFSSCHPEVRRDTVLIVTFVGVVITQNFKKYRRFFCACPVFWYSSRSFIWDIIWNRSGS